MGLKSWITTGDLYSKDLHMGGALEAGCFDTETFARSRSLRLYVQILKQETLLSGMQNGRQADVNDARISFLPLAVTVNLNGRMYLDGGILDPIPVNWMLHRVMRKIW